MKFYYPNKFLILLVLIGINNSVLAQSGRFFEPIDLQEHSLNKLIDLKYADMDGDGVKDLVTASNSQISWLKGLGNGDFAPAEIIEYDASVFFKNRIRAFDVGDINLDGKLDITYLTPDASYLLLNSGDMKFNQSTLSGSSNQLFSEGAGAAVYITPYPIDSLANAIVITDIEVILIRYSEGSNQVIDRIGKEQYSIHTYSDFDGNGENDLIFVSDYQIQWLLNPISNPEIITQELEFNRFYTLKNVEAFDINTDGFKDLIILYFIPPSNYRMFSGQGLEGQVYYLENNENTSFNEKVLIGEVEPGVNGVVYTDFNGDGQSDLLFSTFMNSMNNENTFLLEHNGIPEFQEMAPISEDPVYLHKLYEFDLNEDGLDDIVGFSNQESSIGWFKNGGVDGFHEYETIAQSKMPTPTGILSMDVDEDGMYDLVVSSQAPGKALSWYKNKGDYEFEPGGIIENELDRVKDVYIHDLNNDTRPDLIVLKEFQRFWRNPAIISRPQSIIEHQIAWYENLSNGSFSEKRIIGSDTSDTGNLNFVDVNDDGEEDVVLITSGKSTAFLNGGNASSFSIDNVSFSGFVSDAHTSGDFTGNGKLDLIIQLNIQELDTTTRPPMYVLKSQYSFFDGDTTFVFSRNLRRYEEGVPYTVLEDLNGDGDAELLETSSFGRGNIGVKPGLGFYDWNAQNSSLEWNIIDSSSAGFQTLTVHDFDNDGDNDLVATENVYIDNLNNTWYGGTKLYLNEGEFTFKKVQLLDSLTIGSGEPIKMLSEDLNNDQYPELISYSLESEKVLLYRNSDIPLISNEVEETPQKISLSQNYPNPFNPSTSITYQLPVSSAVKLTVFDVLGREVAVLVDERLTAGTHQIRFDGAALASGIYLYRLEVGNQVQIRKMVLIK